MLQLNLGELEILFLIIGYVLLCLFFYLKISFKSAAKRYAAFAIQRS